MAAEANSAKKGGEKGVSDDASAEKPEAVHRCHQAGCKIPWESRHFSYGSGAAGIYLCPVSPVSVVCRGVEGWGSGRERGFIACDVHEDVLLFFPCISSFSLVKK